MAGQVMGQWRGLVMGQGVWAGGGAGREGRRGPVRRAARGGRAGLHIGSVTANACGRVCMVPSLRERSDKTLRMDHFPKPLIISIPVF